MVLIWVPLPNDKAKIGPPGNAKLQIFSHGILGRMLSLLHGPRMILHRFEVDAKLRYSVLCDGWLLLNIAAVVCGGQSVRREELTNNSGWSFQEKTSLGDRTRFHGIAVSAGSFEVQYKAEVERVEKEFLDAWEPREATLIGLPPDVARFLYPSRYCESDKLQHFAEKEFGTLMPGHSRVAGICNWIHDKIEYRPGATDAHSSAVDCLISRGGVCRDFAHLGIAFSRALGIPARYGSAYAYGLSSPDYHAFFEVWLGDRWWYYDATRLAPQPGFILVGTGHDAADTSVATMSMGVQFESMEIRVSSLSDHEPQYTTSPVGFHG